MAPLVRITFKLGFVLILEVSCTKNINVNNDVCNKKHLQGFGRLITTETSQRKSVVNSRTWSILCVNLQPRHLLLSILASS